MNTIIHSTIIYKIAKDWKHPQCSSIEDWLNILHPHKMDSMQKMGGGVGGKKDTKERKDVFKNQM